MWASFKKNVVSCDTSEREEKLLTCRRLRTRKRAQKLANAKTYPEPQEFIFGPLTVNLSYKSEIVQGILHREGDVAIKGCNTDVHTQDVHTLIQNLKQIIVNLPASVRHTYNMDGSQTDFCSDRVLRNKSRPSVRLHSPETFLECLSFTANETTNSIVVTQDVAT
eukprot:gene167-11596_t